MEGRWREKTNVFVGFIVRFNESCTTNASPPNSLSLSQSKVFGIKEIFRDSISHSSLCQVLIIRGRWNNIPNSPLLVNFGVLLTDNSLDSIRNKPNSPSRSLR